MIVGWTSNPVVPCWKQKMNKVVTFCEASITDGLGQSVRIAVPWSGFCLIQPWTCCSTNRLDRRRPQPCCFNDLCLQTHGLLLCKCSELMGGEGGVYSAPSPYWICRCRKDTTTASVIGFKMGDVRQLLLMWLRLSPVSCQQLLTWTYLECFHLLHQKFYWV